MKIREFEVRQFNRVADQHTKVVLLSDHNKALAKCLDELHEKRKEIEKWKYHLEQARKQARHEIEYQKQRWRHQESVIDGYKETLQWVQDALIDKGLMDAPSFTVFQSKEAFKSALDEILEKQKEQSEWKARLGKGAK